jgi:outer membrane protein assembly factor BamA
MELRTPVIWKFWFTFFGDAGNNWGRFRDVRLDEFLVSVGLGWQYMAPVGPIRLDYARRVVHPTYPASDRLHLSILFAF